jgi:two-component system sensor histidine kinase UhpB
MSPISSSGCATLQKNSKLPSNVGTISFLQHNLRRTPILYRIAIGNAFVIALGAIGGTLIVRRLADQAADWWLILLFLAIGTTLSVVINFWIIKNALRPLSDLISLVDQVQAGSSQIDSQFLEPTDPDISQLASTLDTLVRELNERNLELRALSEQAINALEEERKQIAMTLHDDTGQSLSMVIINLERLEVQIPAAESAVHGKLAETRRLAQEALANLRKIVYGLRPTILDDLGLLPAIRWYARTNLEDAGIMVEVHGNGEFESLSPQVNSTLFRIAQEAVNNIVRHSHATSAEISLFHEGDSVVLEVNDDGRGFDPGTVREQALQSQHFGILGMQERAELVGGSIELTSIPDSGTQIIIQVPCDTSGEE